jgi:hypothetical protein
MGKLAGTFTPSRHRKALDDASNVAEPLAEFINAIKDAASDNNPAISKETVDTVIAQAHDTYTAYTTYTKSEYKKGERTKYNNLKIKNKDGSVEDYKSNK